MHDYRCGNCGDSIFAGMAHSCRMVYAPNPPQHPIGTRPIVVMTEDDVRRIVREEIERARAPSPASPSGAGELRGE